MAFITLEDFRDIYIKLYQRGLTFLLSKVNIDAFKRTQSAFNEKHIENANFWQIPKVKERWNKLITGDSEMSYEEYISQNYFQEEGKIKVLALGSGVCNHEIKLAELNPDWHIDCFDFAGELLKIAEKNSRKKGLDNISFYAKNILEYDFPTAKYDLVFFHASLHHFDNIYGFIKNVVIETLKPGGYLVINEYVGENRLQYSKEQIKYINKALQFIPRKYRKIYKTNLYKNRYYGSGSLRMKIADPSECVDSASILPAIHTYFDIVEEKPYGNNLLQSVFKDIAHHFTDEDLSEEKLQNLERVFELENQFLQSHPSDFVFGVYRMKKGNQ